MTMRTTFLFLFISLSILLTACGSQPTGPEQDKQRSKAELIQQLLHDSQNSPSPERESQQLEAAALLLEEQQRDLTTQIIENLQPEQLSLELFAQYSIVRCELDIQKGEYLQARSVLEAPRLMEQFDNLSHSAQLTLSLLRSEVFALLGSHIASAQQRIYIHPLLDEANQRSNQEAIWTSLMYVPQGDLKRYLTTSMGGEYQGWLELALIAKENQSDLDQQLLQLAGWQQRWLQHPAHDNLPGGLQLIKELAANRPQQVALLLPLTDKLAPFGKAIRDGFIAAMYNTRSRGSNVPALKIYDTESSEDFIDLYQQAINEGAELIIGPLEKHRLSLLFDQGDLPVPTLAMNRLNDYGLPPQQLYQFGLAPQDEAQQVAEIAFLDNRRNALVIAPASDRDEKLSKVFSDKLKELGGQTVAESFYTGQSDYSSSLKQALLLQSSEDRAKRIQRLVGEHIEFSPRRREDIDMVFMLARPQQARSLKPLLAYHYAGDLPVYGTSRVYAGFDEKSKNRDLNGLRFTDMPWVLEKPSALHQQIDRELSQSKQYQRMYALGIDSYQLHPRLRQLEQMTNSRVYGQTGTLKLNQQKQIERRMLFAQIRNSRAKIIPAASQTIDLNITTKEGTEHVETNNNKRKN